MTKADFLKTAQEKYKKAIKKEWVPEMNFIYSDNGWVYEKVCL